MVKSRLRNRVQRRAYNAANAFTRHAGRGRLNGPYNHCLNFYARWANPLGVAVRPSPLFCKRPVVGKVVKRKPRLGYAGF